MATESAADGELSVTLPSPLSEWLDERAAALGVDRERLLVELLETYRRAADLDPEEFDALRAAASTDDASGVGRDELDELDRRIDDVDAALSEHVEDLRSRILQLKDAVESSAPADHDHPETEALSERVETLAADLESVEADADGTAAELEALASTVEPIEDRLETTEDRLTRLARVVVELKRNADRTAGPTDALDSIRRTANRNGTEVAACEGCGERLRIGLLTEAACPHCDRAFRDIEYPSSILGRFKTPRLTGTGSPEPEADDE
jgi:methyl-accepting chemotaxis protein